MSQGAWEHALEAQEELGQNDFQNLYYQQSRWHCKARPKITNNQKLDPIDPDLVGRLNIEALAHESKHIQFAQQAFRLIGGQSVELAVDAEIIPVHGDSHAYFKAIRGELLNLKLLRRRDEYDARDTFSAICPIFPVEKPDRTIRIIFNGRQGNGILERLNGFRLFDINQLREGIQMFGHHEVVLLDYRHYFYQIPMPTSLAKFFAVPFAHVGPAGESEYLLPNVLPMGYHSAPCIAQNLTWCIVMWRASIHESRLGIPVYIDELQDMPEYVPLHDGGEIGRIYVLMDGIAVFARDKTVLRQWRKRLERNSGRFHAIIKNPIDKTQPGKPAIIKVDTEEGVTFAGVNWNSDGVRPDRILEDLPTDRLTWRDMAKIVGDLLWEVRVRGWALADYVFLVQAASTVALEAARAGNGNIEVGYNAAAALHKVQGIDKLHVLWNEMQARPRTPFTAPVRPPGPIYAYASDAHVWGLGWVQFDATEAAGRVLHVRYVKLIEEEVQNYAEFRAVLLVSERVYADAKGPATIALAVDNEAVRSALRKGYSLAPRFQELVQQIRSRNHRWVCGRVTGLLNAADEPSRGVVDIDQLDKIRVKETWKVLRALLDSIHD